jgi:nucleoside-diphosphate-sugar epimerase
VFGLAPLCVPGGLVQAAAGAVSTLPSLPFAPPATEWVEAASHPAIMDVSKAKSLLGWEPRYSALEALRDTLRS